MKRYLTSISLALLSGIYVTSVRAEDGASQLTDWPAIHSAIPQDPALERKVRKLVASMTLRQKVAQMTQAEIKSATPADVKTYGLGSVLNGGGSWPDMEKNAKASVWVKLADQYYAASMASAVHQPVLWGTDAVHGHGNVNGATLFPHNIGLGAAHDPELIGEIGKSVGKAVRATGINWAFAPTVAVVQDPRWGRTYESFSADPLLVRQYAKIYVEGLQGRFSTDGNVVASVKHYMGDGGTDNGKNEGLNSASMAQMINIHGQGYYGALEAGAQTVMASYNSWTDSATGTAYGKMHGSKYMLTDVLKDKLGFDGFVISDWNGIMHVPGCTIDHCAAAINAGVDMIMVPMNWKDFIDNTVKDVETGAIPESRIDDAVTRILRVKLRAHLADKRPGAAKGAGLEASMVDRPLARRAVRESLVLIKNNDAVLPLRPGSSLLVVGKSADNLSNQSGGWSRTWQGDDNVRSDYAHSDSVLEAIRAANAKGSVTYSATGKDVDASKFDVVIAVVGEGPYSESAGDIGPASSLSHTARYPEDLAVLKAVSGKGIKVVTVFETGRPSYANDLINASDAFVVAWLPGSEGKGVTDVLFHNPSAKLAYDFRGSLSFPWPGAACPEMGHVPQFPMGYGLSYAKPASRLPQLEVAATTEGCRSVEKPR
jgi:beta-glucosidase